MEIVRCMIKKHPYLMIFLAWLYTFLMLGRFQIDGLSPVNYISPVVFAAALIIAELLLLRRRGMSEKEMSAPIKKTAAAVLAVTGYALVMLFVFSVSPAMKMLSGRNPSVPFFFGLAALLGTGIYFTVKKRWTVTRASVFIFALAMVFHVFYLMYSGISYQWDHGQILGSGDGHLGYIEYIHNNLSLPQFDPREKWQYYHPPLNHILHAAFMKMQTMLGVNIRIAVYNVTYLPLLYLLNTLLIFVKLSRGLGLKRKYGVFVLAVCACSPAFFYIGGYVNNDMLSVMLMMLSIYLALRWYRERKMSLLLGTAAAFGLGMFTKLSAWMAAVPIAILFIAALAEDIKAKKQKAFFHWFGRMAAFAGIAAPLSFYWSIRNLMRFGVPIGYIPVSQDDTQIITQGVWQRLFDFSPAQFDPPWVAFLKSNDSFNEYNPLIALIKSSSSVMKLPGYINYPLLAATIILCIISFVCMAVIPVRKNTMKPLYKAVLLSFYAVIMVSYYIFCFKYPHVCTEEIRYASPVIFTGAFFSVFAVSELEKTKKYKLLRHIICRSAVFFCVMSLVMIGTDGLMSALYYDLM